MFQGALGRRMYKQGGGHHPLFSHKRWPNQPAYREFSSTRQCAERRKDLSLSAWAHSCERTLAALDRELVRCLCNMLYENKTAPQPAPPQPWPPAAAAATAAASFTIAGRPQAGRARQAPAACTPAALHSLPVQ